MRWDEEEDHDGHVKAHRPAVADAIVGPDRRFRHPAVQAEVERRVGIYTLQVERDGFITWLPHKGEGQSA
jgi:hypothetical protein